MIPPSFLSGIIENIFTYFRVLCLGLLNPTVRFERNVIVKGKLRSLLLGQRVVIQSGTVLHAGGKEWCDYAGTISIGDDGVISPNCVLYGAGSEGIHIGHRFDCGPSVGIYASRTDFRKGGRHIFRAVNIGNDVIVFSHAVIGPGVSIGDRAVIAAGAVVLEDVPKGSLVGGVPAKVLERNVR